MSSVTKADIEYTLRGVKARVATFQVIQDKLFAELNEMSKTMEKALEDLKNLAPSKEFSGKLTHIPTSFKTITRGRYRGRVSSVTCKCGEVTEYRIPLRHIDQFECPKKNRKARK